MTAVTRARAADVILGDRDHASLRCPAHDDRRPSVSARLAADGALLLCCHAGCPTEAVVAAFGCTMADLFPPERPSGQAAHQRPRLRLSELPVPQDTATTLPADTATRLVERLAHKRGWDPAVLWDLGCTAVRDRFGAPRVRFPFLRSGRLVYWQDRLVSDGDPRWMSPAGPVPCPYGADNITTARARGHAYVAEGVTDTVALLHAFPEAAAFGIPGAGGFKAAWAEALSGLAVWVLADADAGGRRLRAEVAQRLAGRAHVWQVRIPPPWPDLDDWRRGVGDEFREQLMAAVAAAAERR